VTSFTKPEVHNVLQCRQRRTEPRPRLPQLTSTEKFVKFGRVVFDTYEWADKQTSTKIGNTCTLPGWEVGRWAIDVAGL